ncbi:MAG: hypothetical protein ABR577_18855 [Pyrinomonadaceae bacterium]
MSSEHDQHKTGIPSKRRGQQTGFAGNPDQNREEKAKTPELRGRRDEENEMFADDSTQHVGGDSATPNSNSPSVPAFNSGDVHAGETGGETAFKKQQEAVTSSEK